MVKSLKDVVLDNLVEKLATEQSIRTILIVSERGNPETSNHNKLITILPNTFPEARIKTCSLRQVCQGKFDLVVPETAYGTGFRVNRALERFALAHLNKYFVMYEDVYHTVRMARATDLKYRLYLMPFVMLAYAMFAFLFVVVPCYLLFPFVKLFSRRKQW